MLANYQVFLFDKEDDQITTYNMKIESAIIHSDSSNHTLFNGFMTQGQT